jgi:hypothetical protein
MDRLLAGQSLYTDGRLTVVNLAREAGIPRTSMCRRFPDLISEFEDHRQRHQAGETRSALQTRLTRLREDRDEWKRKATDYRTQSQERAERVATLENQIRLLDEEVRRLELAAADAAKLVVLRARDRDGRAL